MSTVQASADELRPLALELLGSPVPPQDPYPKYHQLRDAAPLYRDDELGIWFLSRYGDCSEALRDPRLGRAPETVDSQLNGGVRRRRRQRPSMLFLNPPSTPDSASSSTAGSPLDGWRRCGRTWWS
jgi:cytochrome P450